MEMPKPGDAHRRLEMLHGTWVGEERMPPSQWLPQGGTAIGRIVNRPAVDGFAVVQDYQQEGDSHAMFHGHGVFSWDDQRQEYVLHWWDSMGMPPNVFRGRLEGRILTMMSDEGGRQSRVTFDFSAVDAYTFRMDMSGDGTEWRLMMEGRYTRR